jgi:hypothetical protein
MASQALTVMAVLLAGLAAGEARIGGAPEGGPDRSVPHAWAEIPWPFPFDAWGPGRAFRCPATSCGSELTAFVRPKIGFCNCYTGVADDDEIDRVGDVGLIGQDYRPLRPGGPTIVGTMSGRSRAFVVNSAAPVRYALGIAVSKKCDAVVGTVVSGAPLSATHEEAALAFLNGASVAPWAEASVGLQ